MGWFGREPRKVGFGVTDAKPMPTKPAHYQVPKPQPSTRNKAWAPSDSDQTKPEPASGLDILHQRDRAPVVEAVPETPEDEAKRLTLQQIDALKKRSPWLGTLAEKLAKTQIQGRVGTAKQYMPLPPKPRKSRFSIGLVIIAIAFFMLAPFLTEIIAVLMEQTSLPR